MHHVPRPHAAEPAPRRPQLTSADLSRASRAASTSPRFCLKAVTWKPPPRGNQKRDGSGSAEVRGQDPVRRAHQMWCLAVRLEGALRWRQRHPVVVA